MKRVKLAVGISLVFILGVLAGVLGTEAYVKYRFDRFEPGRRPPHVKGHVMERLTKTLNLTAEQRISIQEIVDLTENRLNAVREKHLPEIKKIVEQSFDLMKEKLRPEQVKRLDELHEKLERHREKRRRLKGAQR
jgi:Spy/CpxP family protein refolding chaperone